VPPTGQSLPPPVADGATAPFELPEQWYARVRALAAAEGRRPFDAVAALALAFAVRSAAQGDVVIAVPTADRPLSERRPVLGMFVNTVPVRAESPEAVPLREYLRSAGPQPERAVRHADVPLDRILEVAGIPRGTENPPLCQVMVMLDFPGRPTPTPKPAGLETELLGQIDTGAAQHDLALHRHAPPGGGLVGWFCYRAARYDTAAVAALSRRLWTFADAAVSSPGFYDVAAVAALSGRLRTFADAAVGSPGFPVARLDLVSAEERAQLLSFTQTAVDFGTSRRLHEYILDAAPHRGIADRLLWMQHPDRLGPDDVVLQKTPYTFDVSVWEFFWLLMAGLRIELGEIEAAVPSAHFLAGTSSSRPKRPRSSAFSRSTLQRQRRQAADPSSHP
jgi:non-ribosomal peptide synthetase component F